MKVPFNDLAQQYRLIKDEVDRCIKNVLESGYFVLGENVRLLEEEFAGYCGVKYGIGVASGTDALHLALLACGVGRGDEVITVPFTAIGTALAVSYTLAKPTFVDIDPQTYTMDVSKVEERITKRTKAILPVHLYGHPVDLDPLRELAEKHGLELIEDCAQAHGAEYKGERVGSIGHIGCFSFYPTKNMGAFGDGGMVVTNDEEVAEKLRLLRNIGQSRRYYHLLRGYNSRLDELQAAILRVKLKKLDEWNNLRRKNAQIYNKLLKESPVVTPAEKGYAKHVYHLYVIRADQRDKLSDWLKSKGVITLIHYPIPLHLQEAYRDLGLKKGSIPWAERCTQEVLSLPIYPGLSSGQIEYTSDAINGFFTHE